MSYKVILFDADDTLFDFERSEKEAFRNTMLKFGIDCDDNNYFDIYKELNSVIWKELEKGMITQEQLKIERFKRLKSRIGLSFDEYEFAISYMENLGDCSYLLDGVCELIEELSRKYILSIITNGLTNVQERKIKNSTISKFFQDIVISEEVGISKPDPAIFNYAIQRLGSFSKSEILMVGDSLHSDIKGGINFNIDTCWFNPNKLKNNTDIKPTYKVSNFKELKELLLNKS